MGKENKITVDFEKLLESKRNWPRELEDSFFGKTELYFDNRDQLCNFCLKFGGVYAYMYCMASGEDALYSYDNPFNLSMAKMEDENRFCFIGANCFGGKKPMGFIDLNGSIFFTKCIRFDEYRESIQLNHALLSVLASCPDAQFFGRSRGTDGDWYDNDIYFCALDGKIHFKRSAYNDENGNEYNLLDMYWLFEPFQKAFGLTEKELHKIDNADIKEMYDKHINLVQRSLDCAGYKFDHYDTASTGKKQLCVSCLINQTIDLSFTDLLNCKL